MRRHVAEISSIKRLKYCMSTFHYRCQKIFNHCLSRPREYTTSIENMNESVLIKNKRKKQPTSKLNINKRSNIISIKYKDEREVSFMKFFNLI